MIARGLLGAVIAILAAATTAAQQGTVRVTVARANVRQTASDRSAVVSQVTYGTVLDLAAVDGDWFRVYVPIGALRVEAYLSRKVAVLVAATEEVHAAAASTPAANKTAPGISIATDASGKTIWLSPVGARAIPITQHPATLAALAAGQAVDDAVEGRTKLPADPSSEITWVWIVDRETTPVVLTDARPSFFAAFRDAPGVDVNELVPTVVRLTTSGAKTTVVAMLRGRADAASRTEADWTVSRDLQQDVMKTGIVGGAIGTMTVRLSSSLTPGDYAVVLRPAFPRKYAGREVLGDQGIGSVMSVAWVFTVRPKAPRP